MVTRNLILKIKYLGLARQLAGQDEEELIFPQASTTTSTDSENDSSDRTSCILLEDLISRICKNHPGELSEAFASKGGTPLGQLVLQIGDRVVRVRDSKNIKVNERDEISVLMIPTIVGG